MIAFKRICTLVVFLLLFAGSYRAQNLVNNPSFEQSTSCPTITTQYHLCTGWLNCNGNVGPGLWGTPDFYHTCGTFHPIYNPVPPNTAIGTINPHTGGGLMGIICYNTPYPDYREYLSSQLNCTMTPGNTYTVSFWVNVGTLPKYKYNMSHLGVYLSGTMPTQVGFNLINVVPQFEVTTVISNTVWVQHSFTINPTANFTWITLGCFRTDAQIQTTQPTPAAPNPYANWYLDDISVIGSPSVPANIAVVNSSCNLPNGSATITPLSGSYSYTWLPGNQNTSFVNNVAPGTYTVLLSNACSFDTKTLTVGSSVGQTLTVNSPSICALQTVTLQANLAGGTPPFNYQWSNGPALATNIFTVNNTSVYTCTVTDNSGCVSIKSSTVSLTPLNVDFNFSVNPCSGAVNVTNNTNGATNYTLNFGDGFTTNQPSAAHPYTLAGTYSITLIGANGTACKDSIKKVVTINSITHSSFTFTDAVCDSIVDLNNTSIGATSGFWDFGDGFTSTQMQPGGHEFSAPGIYTITLITNPGGLCPDTVHHIVSVSYNSIADFSLVLDPCNRSVHFTNLSINTTNFYWDLGDATTGPLSSSFTHTYPANNVDDYTITLIVNHGSSCADTIQKIISLDNSIGAAFDYSVDPCSGMATFTNQSVNATFFSWTFDKTNFSNANSPQFQFTTAGEHTVILISSVGAGCADSSKKIINVDLANVIADFELVNTEYSNEVVFTNKSVNGQMYLWDFNDGTWTSETHPKHEFYDVSKFKVCLAAWNTLGCGDTICREVTLKPEWTLYVPNTFTPDDNGLNDLFKAVGTNIRDFQMIIFDRWGKELFRSNEIQKGWNGFYKGKMSQDDVYVWKINFTDMSSKTHLKVGHMLLMK